MNYEWTNEQKEIRDKVVTKMDDSFLDNVEALQTANPEKAREIILKTQSTLAGTGFLSVMQGPNNSADALLYLAAAEALTVADTGLFMAEEITTRLYGGLLAGAESSDFSETEFAAIAEGKLIASVALPDSNGNGFAQAEKVDDGVALSGSWSLLTNGPIADRFAVFASIEDKPTLFILNADDPGVQIGERVATMGYQGMMVSGLTLDRAKVKPGRVLENPPFDFALNMADFILTVGSTGLAERMLEAAKTHAKKHKSGGKVIIKYQEIGFKLAEMYTLLQTAQWYQRRAAWMLAKNDSEAGILIRCAKIFTSESSEQIASWAMQILAGHGYVSGNPVEKGYREAKFASLAGTTNEVARMKIADEILTKF